MRGLLIQNDATITLFKEILYQGMHMGHFISSKTTVRWVVLVTASLMVMMSVAGCASKAGDDDSSTTSETEQGAPSVESSAEDEVPDPSGTYSDGEGGLSFTFLSTGKFYQELLGETSFGTWTRSGDEASITFDDGSTMYAKLGDGYVVFNGMRLTK